MLIIWKTFLLCYLLAWVKIFISFFAIATDHEFASWNNKS